MPRPRVLSLPERLDAHPEFDGRGVTIAFVDAGFFAHPDLMRPEKRVRAFIDVTRDAAQGTEFFSAHARAWHGTMTSCAAAGNGYLSGGRYRGLASGAEVVLIKASTDAGEILGTNVAAAMRFALNHKELGIRIVNVSMGVEPDDPHVKDVEKATRDLVAAGITVFAAAGNSPGVPPEPPGCYADAITVGGGNDGNTTGTDDDRPWPSSYGEVGGVQKPDLLAPAFWLPAPMIPGTLVAREAGALFQVLSIVEEITAEQAYRAESGLEVDGDDRDDALTFMASIEARLERGNFLSAETQHVDGTSFASPIVASIAAQMLEADPSLTPALLRKGLLETAVPLADVERIQQGAGVVRARAAVEWARARASRR
jgi:serine protease AprX